MNCYINTSKGFFGRSYSLEDSIERNVFDKIVLKDTLISLNDTTSFYIKNCFIESRWVFGENNESIRKNGQQLIIELRECEFVKDYLTEWIILYKKNLRKGLGKVGDHSLYISELNDDIEKIDFIVFKGHTLVNDDTTFKERYLGEFSLKIYDTMD